MGDDVKLEVERQAATMEDIEEGLHTQKVKRQQETELHHYLITQNYHHVVTRQIREMAAQQAQQHADLVDRYDELRELLYAVGQTAASCCAYEEPLPFSFKRWFGSCRVHPECACIVCARLW